MGTGRCTPAGHGLDTVIVALGTAATMTRPSVHRVSHFLLFLFPAEWTPGSRQGACALSGAGEPTGTATDRRPCTTRRTAYRRDGARLLDCPWCVGTDAGPVDSQIHDCGLRSNVCCTRVTPIGWHCVARVDESRVTTPSSVVSARSGGSRRLMWSASLCPTVSSFSSKRLLPWASTCALPLRTRIADPMQKNNLPLQVYLLTHSN